MQTKRNRSKGAITEAVIDLRVPLPPDGTLAGGSEEIEYRPVPPNRSFTARVRYRLRGRGEPLPYPLEDE